MEAPAGPAMEAKGLYHIYRETDVETVALRGADLTLDRNSWTSVMGPSGSGKSTLVHVMSGLLEPNGGSVMIHGEDLTRLAANERAKRRRRGISVVLQRDNLHPLLDVAGNIALPLRLDGLSSTEASDRAERLLDAVGLAERRRHTPGQLSGGEAQRVAIAVAMAPRPEVLLADELTGELDTDTARGVLDLLEGLRREEATAVLTVTHNPEVAARADRRLTMRDGQIVNDG
jgi:ABC-type lipoprotein export system ATPase subunit